MQETEIYPLRIPKSTMDEVRRISKKRNITQAQLLRTFVVAGAETHRDMERLGLDVVYDFTYYLKEAIKEKMNAGSKKQMKLPL